LLGHTEIAATQVGVERVAVVLRDVALVVLTRSRVGRARAGLGAVERRAEAVSALLLLDLAAEPLDVGERPGVGLAVLLGRFVPVAGTAVLDVLDLRPGRGPLVVQLAQACAHDAPPELSPVVGRWDVGRVAATGAGARSGSRERGRARRASRHPGWSLPARGRSWWWCPGWRRPARDGSPQRRRGGRWAGRARRGPRRPSCAGRRRCPRRRGTSPRTPRAGAPR